MGYENGLIHKCILKIMVSYHSHIYILISQVLAGKLTLNLTYKIIFKHIYSPYSYKTNILYSFL